MKWNELTDDEKIVELTRQSQYMQPGSAAADVFGARWDDAAKEAEPFGLSAAQGLAARRLGMSPREYGQLISVENLNDFREAEAAEQLRAQALRDVELERIRDGLRGAA